MDACAPFKTLWRCMQSTRVHYLIILLHNKSGSDINEEIYMAFSEKFRIQIRNKFFFYIPANCSEGVRFRAMKLKSSWKDIEGSMVSAEILEQEILV